jgi:SAM-dependent methyltransferase
VSKRPDETETPDMEAGMTTAERRRRRRRGGGLRVPSDNVPRRTPTQPPVVAPVPEDPNLAVSIAYSFDGSGAHRANTDEMPAIEARPDTLTGDGPDVGDIMAPEAQATVVDEDDGPFEVKTREMTAVDLEELGLEDPSEASDGKSRRAASNPPSVDAVGAVDTIIVDDEMATTIAPPPRPPSGRIDALATAPSPQASSPGLTTVPQSSAPSMPSAGAPPTTVPPPMPARAKAPTPAPPVTSIPAAGAPFGTVPAPRAESPDPRAASFGEEEKSVEIEIDEPSRPGGDDPIRKRGPDARVGRAQTVALSDDDLEELMDGGSGRIRNAVPSGETVQLTDKDLEDVRERATTPRLEKLGKATKDESGEIVVDVMEEIDSGDVAQAVPVRPLAAAPASGPVAAPAAAPPTPSSPAIAVGAAPASAPNGPSARSSPSNPPPIAPAAQTTSPGTSTGTTNPPPLGAREGASGAPTPPPPPAAHAQHSPPPTPVVHAKGDGHTPPPPPKAPPPAPGKKPAATTSAAAVAHAAKSPADRRAKRGKPWFEEIFDEDYLRTLPFLTPQATQAEAQFVIDALSVQPGAQLLDLGCGYGRHAMELAARGFHMVGLDLSLPLLLRGADEAQRRGLSINFVHADMRELDFDAQFDGVYCLFSTFGFFDDETNKKTATAVARALKPGGRCVFEVLNRDYVISELPTRVWWEGDGCVVLEEVEFNYFSSRIHSNRSVVFDDGRQIEQEISIRAYSLHELGKLLHSAGFRVVEVSGSVHTRGRFFGNHSRHIIVVAEKKANAELAAGK